MDSPATSRKSVSRSVRERLAGVDLTGAGDHSGGASRGRDRPATLSLEP